MASQQQPRIAVLLPCYNEEAAIARRSPASARRCRDATIYVYDNNSRDRTREVAAAAGAIVRTERQQGKGNVVRRMFADIDADVYVMADGDLTYDPDGRAGDGRHAPRRAARHGRRHPPARGRGRLSRRPRARQPLFTGLLAGLFGRSFTDIFSGYRVFSRRFVKSFPVLSRGFEIETEISVHALELRMPVGEVETAYGARPEGSQSKLSTFRDGWRILTTIATLYRIERPVLFFGRIGALLVVARLILADPAGRHLSPHRPGAALPDRDPGHRPDHHRGAVLLRRPDPRHRHPRPPRGPPARLSGAAGPPPALELPAFTPM